MSAKEKLKSYLLGKTEETPPENVGVDGTLIREVLDAKGAEILGAVNGALDDRLKAFEPMLASFKAKAEEEEEERKEKEALAQINKSRVARGLKPIAEEDDMDKDKKEEAPGKHGPGRKSKSSEYEDDEKKDKDAHAEIAKMKGQIDGILKGIKEVGLSVHDPLAVDESNTANTYLLKTTGKNIPFEKSWKWVLNDAPIMRGSLKRNGNYAEISEFDVLVANTGTELEKAGVPMPNDITKLN